MIHLDDANTTSNLQRRTIIPHGTSHIHVLIQRRTSGEVDKVVYRVLVVNRPGHLATRITGSGSAHGEGDLGAGIGQREGCGLWGGGDVENLRHVGDLEPENLTIGVVVGLDQVLHRIDLCSTRLVYASRNIISK